MTALLNFLAELDSVKFHSGLIVAAICMSILIWIMGAGRSF